MSILYEVVYIGFLMLDNISGRSYSNIVPGLDYEK